MRWWVWCWAAIAIITCVAFGCGGRAESDGVAAHGGAGAVSGAGVTSVGSNDAGSSGAGDGAGGVHSVFVACQLCPYPEFDCAGPALPESQSTFRTNVSAYGCDFEPIAGFAGPVLHIDCKDGPTLVTCADASQCIVIFARGEFSVQSGDGGSGYTCRAYSGVK